MTIKNFGTIKWVIEAFFRMSQDSPRFFKWLIFFGILTVIAATSVHGCIHWWHCGLPGFLVWLDNGFYAGFGTGLSVAASLTVDRKELPTNAKKNMPVTAKKEGL